MGLQVNLSKARLAVDHVRSHMTVGAGNKFRDVARSMGRALLCVPASRSVDIAVPRGPIPAWLRGAASKAKHVGCGNCGEQAALAFVDLYGRLHARPLDYMVRTNADHAFVVIGRARRSRIGNLMTWGNDAVVCDPWDNKAYAAWEIPTTMYGGGVFKPTSVFRVD